MLSSDGRRRHRQRPAAILPLRQCSFRRMSHAACASHRSYGQALEWCTTCSRTAQQASKASRTTSVSVGRKDGCVNAWPIARVCHAQPVSRRRLFNHRHHARAVERSLLPEAQQVLFHGMHHRPRAGAPRRRRQSSPRSRDRSNHRSIRGALQQIPPREGPQPQELASVCLVPRVCALARAVSRVKDLPRWGRGERINSRRSSNIDRSAHGERSKRVPRWAAYWGLFLPPPPLFSQIDTLGGWGRGLVSLKPCTYCTKTRFVTWGPCLEIDQLE
jgi:hypothetical protein